MTLLCVRLAPGFGPGFGPGLGPGIGPEFGAVYIPALCGNAPEPSAAIVCFEDVGIGVATAGIGPTKSGDGAAITVVTAVVTACQIVFVLTWLLVEIAAFC